MTFELITFVCYYQTCPEVTGEIRGVDDDSIGNIDVTDNEFDNVTVDEINNENIHDPSMEVVLSDDNTSDSSLENYVPHIPELNRSDTEDESDSNR